MLWYNLFSENLYKMGSNINPYNKCLANKEIGGKKCTVVWYVEDLKVFHMDEEVFMKLLKLIESKFEGGIDITIRNNNVDLVMYITLTYEGTVYIRMD